MTRASSMLHVRIDDATKDGGRAVLDAIGLSPSDAVRLLYKRLIADQAFPLELKVPNAATREAMAESEVLLAGGARFDDASSLIADLEREG